MIKSIYIYPIKSFIDSGTSDFYNIQYEIEMKSNLDVPFVVSGLTPESAQQWYTFLLRLRRESSINGQTFELNLQLDNPKDRRIERY